MNESTFNVCRLPVMFASTTVCSAGVRLSAATAVAAASFLAVDAVHRLEEQPLTRRGGFVLGVNRGVSIRQRFTENRSFA
jgi:hypothetical protein